MPEPVTIVTLPYGFIRTFDDNELEHVSTIEDPPKYRVGVLEEQLVNGTGNIGALSFNTVRPNGEHDEWGLVSAGIRRHPGTGLCYCSIAISVRDETQQDTREVAAFSPYGAVFNVPVFAPNLGGSSQQTHVTRFYSSDDRYCFNVQGDDGGKIVQYDTHGTADESQWTAVGQFRATP